MRSSALLSLVLLCCLYGCARQTVTVSPFVEVPEFAAPVDYVAKIEPILNNRCVVCHSCYNSPCQLKLSSFEGLDRGATKKAVYNSSRLTTMEPTRLFMDAETTAQWRTRGFHSVTENTAPEGENDSLMMQLLFHKKDNPMKDGDEFFPEAEDLTCPENGVELGAYLDKHPNKGMPFGFPPLSQDDFETIAGWLAQGAHGPSVEQQAELVAIPENDVK